MTDYELHLEGELRVARNQADRYKAGHDQLFEALAWAMSRLPYPEFESEWNTEFIEAERAKFREVRKLLGET